MCLSAYTHALAYAIMCIYNVLALVQSISDVIPDITFSTYFPFYMEQTGLLIRFFNVLNVMFLL